MGEKKIRRQITFDLSDDKLKIYYPRPKWSMNPSYHKKAWKDIASFMKKRNFEHRQRSVYASQDGLTRVEINALIDSMIQNMPWLCNCLNAIDMTDIGKQHDLMPVFETYRIELEKHVINDNNRETENSNNVKQKSLASWEAMIEKEKTGNPDRSKNKDFREKNQLERY